jgi:hypothetical protein
MKSGTVHASVPLHLSSGLVEVQRSTSEQDIIDWLKTSYTPLTSNLRKMTFQEVAKCVKIATKVRLAFRHCRRTHGEYVFDVDDSELEDINAALDGVDEWDWDIWRLREASKGRPLQALGWHLLHKHDLIQGLGLDWDVVRRWLAFVEGLYHDTPYHNSTHAADVLQAVHHLLVRAGTLDILSHCPTTVLALLLAAMLHDAGHDGRTNLYHQNALTPRALAFNDQSIQENYHLAAVFSAMAADPAIDILAALRPAQAREIRRLAILTTLATDMKSHFLHLQEFKAAIAAAAPAAAAPSPAAAAAAVAAAWRDDPARVDRLCAHVLHAADLSNPCRPGPLSRRWAERVMEEFFAQATPPPFPHPPAAAPSPPPVRPPPSPLPSPGRTPPSLPPQGVE